MKTVVKLIAKCICVLLPLIVFCVYTATHPLSYWDNETPCYVWNRDFTNTRQEKYYDTVILGDSLAGSAFVPEILSDSTLSLALGGLTPVETYYIFEDWLANNPPPKACFISFAYWHFHTVDAFWTRCVYSHRFRLPQIMEMIKTAEEYHYDKVLVENWPLDLISYELYLPNKYIAAFMNGGFNQRSQANHNTLERMTLHRGHYMAFGTTGFNNVNPWNYFSFRVDPYIEHYYRKILDLCRENGISAHVVFTPLSDNTVYYEDFEPTFSEYYEKLMADYPGLTVDTFGVYDKAYFGDALHSNLHGSLRFSRELKERFPQYFGSYELSPAQAAGIDDYISYESKPEQILNWIEGYDYSMIVSDPQDRFASVYEQRFENKTLDLGQCNVEGSPEGTKLYFVSGINDASPAFSISAAEDGYKIQLPGQDAYDWQLVGNNTVDIAVIDHCRNCVVCTKTFRYNDTSFDMF